MAFTSLRLRHDKRLRAAATFGPPLRQGEISEGVEILQQALVDLGFRMPISTRATGFLDGIYGDETVAVVTMFQARNGLQRDGVAGKNTLRRLDALITEREAKARAEFIADLDRPIPVRKFYAS
jgi:peptidoglycan hydrolase-like protein with peptidoglycan-binding domain